MIDPSTDGALSGLRVLDLTRVLAGPYCTMVLADLGADVVKVERPLVGDDARHFGPFLPSGASAYFASLNRGKRSVVLDLKQPIDRQTLKRLAGQADVLVENFRPGTLAAFGIDLDELRSVHPELIVASVSGFGQSGPLASRPAYDVIIQAMSGLMSITGTDAEHPVRVGTSISDIIAGLFAAIGILAELHWRGRTGRAAHLDVAMLDASVAVLENALSRCDVTGRPPEPLGTRHPSITPFQAFQTADGEIVIAAGNDVLFQKLCNLVGCGELAADPRFATNAARTNHCDALEAELTRRLVRRTAASWLAELEQAGIPSAPIRRLDEVLADPHLTGRGMFHTMTDQDGTTFRTAGSPLATPPLSPHAPALGEHTSEVLKDWLGETESQGEC